MASGLLTELNCAEFIFINLLIQKINYTNFFVFWQVIRPNKFARGKRISLEVGNSSLGDRGEPGFLTTIAQRLIQARLTAE